MPDLPQHLPPIVLGVVFGLIAFRRFGDLRLQIWQIMLGGALAVILGGAIAPARALAAIDANVLGFLFGVFALGQALVASGWLYAESAKILGKLRSADELVLAVLIGSGLTSAILMNDTLAVIGTPLVITLARMHGLSPSLLLLALAFGVTIGSAMSPIGNPQNLLIALQGGLENPFLDFLRVLAVPTLLNLLLAYAVLRIAFWSDFHGAALSHPRAAVGDRQLAHLARWVLGILLALVLLRLSLGSAGSAWTPPLTLIGIGSALPVLIFSKRRRELLRGIDWHTLAFFAAMFVLMQSVWDSGVLQEWLPSESLGIAELLGVSVIGSQIVSNVPLVALLLPLLESADPNALLTLAAGSTIAGNLTLIGAASNVIIAQRAESHGAHLGFWKFFAIGAPLTTLNVVVYWLWLSA